MQRRRNAVQCSAVHAIPERLTATLYLAVPANTIANAFALWMLALQFPRWRRATEEGGSHQLGNCVKHSLLAGR
jgi:hypothetical protein